MLRKLFEKLTRKYRIEEERMIALEVVSHAESILIFKNNSFVKFIILKNVIAFKNSAGDLI